MLVIPGAEEAQAAAAAANEETTVTEEPTTETAAVEETEFELEVTPDPLEVANKELATEKEQRIRLEGRLEAMEAKPEPAPAQVEPPKELTRQQLQEAVDNGQIDGPQMETMWANQNEARILRKIEVRNDERDSQRTASTLVEADTAKHLVNHPDIRTVGTSDWNKLKTSYDYLIQLGHKDNKTTELAAMQAAFGSPDPIRESSASRRQTSSETSTSQGGVGGDGRSANIWTKVPDHLREPYKKMVADGVMTLEDVKKDIPYMKDQPS